MNREEIQHQILQISDSQAFDEMAMFLFQRTTEECETYKRYLELIDFAPEKVRKVEEIPGLPISVFKNRNIKTGNWIEKEIFTSSGTGGNPSRHLVRDKDWYITNARNCFNQFYPDQHNSAVIALLPSYLEREGSSLITMVTDFIESSENTLSGFYLKAGSQLKSVLTTLEQQQNPGILIGVSFALLDLAESYPFDNPYLLIMETGGMKGRKAEMSKKELHDVLKKAFNKQEIHGEYGMTELFSQAYAFQDGHYQCPKQMQVYAKDMNDPFMNVKSGRSGLLQFIDLANFDTCPFILTDDIGRTSGSSAFEILGRMEGSELRGCNLLLFE